jgi:hypothetical protein
LPSSASHAWRHESSVRLPSPLEQVNLLINALVFMETESAVAKSTLHTGTFRWSNCTCSGSWKSWYRTSLNSSSNFQSRLYRRALSTTSQPTSSEVRSLVLALRSQQNVFSRRHWPS